MCGIIAYVGTKPAQPILLDGLKRMEYRGYDSAGIAVQENGAVEVHKKAGKMQALLDEVADVHMQGTVGIGHTRWATHGEPTDINAHPHAGKSGKVHIIHNGIIENFHELKQRFLEAGHTFTSQTDTEVLAHLIEETLEGAGSLEEAVRESLKQVSGAYGLAVMSMNEPGKIVAARLGSPLVLGLINDGEYVLASDPTAIIPHTRNVIYLEEGEMVTISPEGYAITTLDNETVQHDVNTIEWDVAQAEKQGHPHFTIKEIFEQPDVVRNGLRGRLVPEEGLAHLGGFIEKQEEWRRVKRIIMVACGGAAFAARVGEYMIEEYAGIPVEVEIGSEFRYRKPVLDEQTAIVVVSQSGETADTLASLQEAKRQGVLSFGVVNVVGSTMARDVESGAYIHAGPEIGVASTKAMTGMINILALFTMCLGRQRGMSLVTGKRIAEELMMIPEKIDEILHKSEEMKLLAEKYKDYEHAFYLGRKYNFAIALEGALKLKEICYVHAEAYPSGELKHGPLALVDDRFFSVFIIPKDSVYEKNLSSLQELRARKGVVLAVTTEGNREVEQFADDVVYIPKTLEMLTPLLSMTPLHLFAYHMAALKGVDVDQPRNLAKSVTVE